MLCVLKFVTYIHLISVCISVRQNEQGQNEISGETIISKYSKCIQQFPIPFSTYKNNNNNNKLSSKKPWKTGELD